MDSQEVVELRRYFVVLDEGLQREIRQVAELLSALDSKIGREFGALREEMRKEFAETKALLLPGSLARPGNVGGV